MDKDTIVVIDNDPDVLNSLENLFELSKYRVLTTQSEQGCIDILSENKVAVLILEPFMPGIVGKELVKKIGEISPETSVIALSKFQEQHNFTKTLNDWQITQIICKPYDHELLKSVVNENIEKYKLADKNRQLLADLDLLRCEDDEKVKEQINSLEETTKLLQVNMKQVISLLSQMIGFHCDQFFGHSQRVARLSKAIAVALELPDEFVSRVETAGYLHDLGVVFIPKEILLKNERDMRPKEIELFHMHSEKGAKLLKRISAFSDISEMVEEHHEAYDGSGYSGGLKGDDICLGARIIALADLFDQELHPFGNKVISTIDKALDLVYSESGKRLDPSIVKVFMDKVRQQTIDMTSDVVELPARFLKPQMKLCRDVTSMSGAILLKKGTVLTDTIIDKLTKNSSFDENTSRLFLTRESVLKATGQTDKLSPYIKDDINNSEYPLILAVDDEQSVLNALKRELRGKYNLVTEVNPAVALQKIKQMKFKAVLSDFNMPVVKGDEFIRQVRIVDPNIPCIILTGHATRTNVERLIHAGDLSRIITKPWDKEELLDTLKSVIN